MLTLRTSSLLCFAATVLLACKPAEQDEQPPAPITADDAADVFARQLCAGFFTCSCDASTNYTSEAQCVEQLAGQLQTDLDALLAAGATWNDDCAGQLVDTWSDWACLGPESAVLHSRFDARLCPVVKGVIGPGDPCNRSVVGDDCSPGLACYSGVCVEITVPVPVGEVCEQEWEELPCVDGSYCSYDEAASAQVCKPLPAEGDPCDPNNEYLCGPASRDLVCGIESGVCESAPGVGEPCHEYGFLCAPGAYCDGGKDFTCQARFELGDGCGADAVCPIDSSCIANICEADPAAICNLGNFDLL